jgi:uncharacterized protein (DUF58 family)
VSPTPRAALAVAVAALLALFLPLWVAALALLALAGAVAVDALSARSRPEVRRELPHVMTRGDPGRLAVTLPEALPGKVRVRQPLPPDVLLDPSEAEGGLDSRLVGRRRGRHPLPPVALRVEGPLGLGCWYHEAAGEAELLVYPDLPAARRLAQAVRQGRFREVGQRPRGPLGLGVEFESIREYQPDDDIRQVNWAATVRLGRPMSNQYRVEQDREVVCVVDAGRLMSAPLGDRTRLDAALDVVAAVCAVADELGDRSGALAFDDEVRRSLPPRRRGARDVVHALFDLEPRPVDADYELAFRSVGGLKRAFVLVLTDLLDPAAARPLVEAVPVLARRHAVAVASARDPDLEALAAKEPQAVADVFATTVALDVLDARAEAAAAIRRAGAEVIEASPERLSAACVSAYLRAKARARL